MRIQVNLDVGRRPTSIEAVDRNEIQWLGMISTEPGHRFHIWVNRLVYRINIWLMNWFGYRRRWSLPHQWLIIDHNDELEGVRLDETRVRWPHWVPPELRHVVSASDTRTEWVREVLPKPEDAAEMKAYFERLAAKGVIKLPVPEPTLANCGLNSEPTEAPPTT